MLNTLQKAAAQLDADFRRLNDGGGLANQASIATTLLTIANFIGKEVLASASVYKFASDDGNTSATLVPSSFALVAIENTEGQNLLAEGQTNNAISAYLLALLDAAETIVQSKMLVTKPDWKTVDATISGMSACLVKLPMLEMAAALDECALIVGQQSQGRKSLDVYNTRMALSKIYFMEYQKNQLTDYLAQAARHGEIACEMSYQVCQDWGKNVQVVSRYTLDALKNFWKLINAAPADTPMNLFYMNTFVSTFMVAIERTMKDERESGASATEPSRH